MADRLPPWSIDSLDNLKASIDQLTLTLDSSLYTTSVTLWDAYGSVSASATVSAEGIRVQLATASISASASASCDGTRVQYADASVSASSTVSCDATRVQYASGSVDA